MPESADQQGRDAQAAAASPRPQMLQIDLQTRFGRVKGNLSVPPGAVRLAELAWNSMAIDERLIGMAVAAEAKQGRQVSCKKGCGACCYQAVPLSPAEAWMIADVVASLPAERKAATLERFAAAKARLADAGFGGRSLKGAGEAEVVKLGIDYFRLRIPCPFLVDDACSIHPSRPSACREFLVSSPAENCSDPAAKEIRSIPTAAILTEALSKVSALMMDGEPFAIPLPLALEWAAENREAGGKRYDAALLLTALVEFLGSSRPGPAHPGPAERNPAEPPSTQPE